MQNNNAIFDTIGSGNKNVLMKISNTHEFERVLQETGLSIDELMMKCSQDDVLKRVLSGRISKNASRQGGDDEKKQIQVCANIAKEFGIQINILANTAFRPTKTGEIISKSEMKSKNICKDACLKSFDAKISGKIEGWMFAKVVLNNGGHQDNVFEEADSLCNWVETFHRPEFYVLLLDTDLIEKRTFLQEKYKHINNIMITNHLDFQQYILNTYGNVDCVDVVNGTDNSK